MTPSPYSVCNWVHYCPLSPSYKFVRSHSLFGNFCSSAHSRLLPDRVIILHIKWISFYPLEGVMYTCYICFLAAPNFSSVGAISRDGFVTLKLYKGRATSHQSRPLIENRKRGSIFELYALWVYERIARRRQISFFFFFFKQKQISKHCGWRIIVCTRK